MSLYNKLLSQTTNNDYTVMKNLYKIGEGHKQSYVERQLRKVCEDTGIKPYWGYQVLPVTAKNEKGTEYIIGYQRLLASKLNL